MSFRTLPNISDEEWVKFKQMARDWCLKSLGHDNMMPHLWVWSVRDLHPDKPMEEPKDGPRFSAPELLMGALAVPWPAGREDAFLSIATKLYKERRIPIALMFLSEAWQSQRKPEDQFSNRKLPMPRDDPNRKEILQCMGLRLVDKEGRMYAVTREPGSHLAWGWNQEVGRDKDNNMFKVGEAKEGDEHVAQILYRFMAMFAEVVCGLRAPSPTVDADFVSPEDMAERLKKDKPE